MMLRPALAATTLLFLSALPEGHADDAFQISPAEPVLKGNFYQCQLLVTAPGPMESSQDLTSQANYQSSDNSVVTVAPSGRLMARSNGTAQVTVTVNAGLPPLWVPEPSHHRRTKATQPSAA